MDKSQIDQSVMDLLTKVRQKKEAIKKARVRPQWKTNCSISFSSDINERLNIQTVRDKNLLIHTCGTLLEIRNNAREASKLLGIEYDGEYQHFPINDWIDDLKTRANMLLVDEEEKEVEALDRRINKLVSPEQRREMELLELQKLLSD